MTGQGFDVSYRRWVRRYYACGNVGWKEAEGCARFLVGAGYRSVRITLA